MRPRAVERQEKTLVLNRADRCLRSFSAVALRCASRAAAVVVVEISIWQARRVRVSCALIGPVSCCWNDSCLFKVIGSLCKRDRRDAVLVRSEV